MITKFEKYNESIKSLLVGPTKEEASKDLMKKYKNGKIDVLTYYTKCKEYDIEIGITKKEIWNKLGYKEIFNTPEEFFLSLIKNMKDKKSKGVISKVKNNKVLIEHTTLYNHLYVNYDKIWKVLKDMFDMNYDEIKIFIIDMVKKYFGWFDFDIRYIHEMYT